MIGERSDSNKQKKTKNKVNKQTTLWTCDHVTTKYNKIILVIVDGTWQRIKLDRKEELLTCIQQ